MADDLPGAPRAASLDIQALLRVALEQGPRDDVQERVLSRVAAVTTAAELARLLFVAPVQWLLDDLRPADDADDADPAEEPDTDVPRQ